VGDPGEMLEAWIARAAIVKVFRRVDRRGDLRLLTPTPQSVNLILDYLGSVDRALRPTICRARGSRTRRAAAVSPEAWCSFSVASSGASQPYRDVKRGMGRRLDEPRIG
jgi:hypothetical protein